jgi:hypothetical protein
MTRIDLHESSKLTFAESAAASTPASGLVVVYAKTDGLLYSKDDAGAETALSGAALAAHLADTSDAHDASAISIADAGNDFTATDVEGALAELQADNEAHVAAADPHPGYVLESAIAAKGDLYVGTADNTVGILTVGSDDEILIADSGETTGLKWGAAPGGSGDVATDAIWDAGGDLAVGTGADTANNLAVGSDYQVLRARAAATLDVEWAGGMTLHEEKVAGVGGSASFDFTSIPGTARHIVIECMMRGEKAAAFDDLYLRVNGDTGTNYDIQRYISFQTSEITTEQQGTAQWLIAQPGGASATAGLFSFLTIEIPYYASTLYRKSGTVVGSEVTAESSGGVSTNQCHIHWRSAAAITQVTLLFAGGDVAEGSQASLYLVS